MTLDHTIYFFYFACYAHHRDLHSFPTRRSSDLDKSKSWKERKQHTIDIIKTARKEVKYLIVADKLENLLSNEAALKDRKSTRLNSSHVSISYAVFCLKKKKILTIYYHKSDTH